MPTATQKLVAGTLLLGASTLTSNALVGMLAQSTGDAFFAEGLLGLFGRTQHSPSQAVLQAGQQAILQAVDRLEDAYRHESPDTSAFALLRECAPALASAEYPAGATTLVAIQTSLHGSLDLLLYGHAARDFIQDRLLDSVAAAFREALAADPAAWNLFHGALLESISTQLAAFGTQLDQHSTLLALLRREPDVYQALQQLVRQLDALNERLRAGQDSPQQAGNTYINSSHAQGPGASATTTNHITTAPPVAGTQAASDGMQHLALFFQPLPGGARIRWQGHNGSVVASSFMSPFAGTDLALVLRLLDDIQRGGDYAHKHLDASQRQRLAQLGLLASAEAMPGSDTARQVGQALYAALTSDPRAGEMLYAARSAASGEDAALTIHLHFPAGAVALAALPWELLWQPGEATPLLFRYHRHIQYVRHLESDQGSARRSVRQEPLRILAIRPHHRMSAEHRTEEQAERRNALVRLERTGQIEMQEIDKPATRSAVIDAVQDFEPHVIHYYGHGSYDPQRGGGLLFDTAAGGKDVVPVERLQSLFAGVRMVVLLACQSAMVGSDDTGDMRSGIAPALSATGIEVVLGAQVSLRVDAAIRMTARVYAALARGESVQQAVAQARQALHSESDADLSWYVPALYLHTRDHGPFHV